jgi:hypothetical protein
MRFKTLFLENYTDINEINLYKQAEPYLNLYYILDYMIWRYGVDKNAYEKDKHLFDGVLMTLK